MNVWRDAAGAVCLMGVGIGGISAQQSVVPLVLNHLELVLDSATYHDVKAAPFMSAYFAADSDITDAMHGGMPGVRFLGKYDWITFAAPSADHATGDVTMALSSPVPGVLKRLASLLQLTLVYTTPGVTDARPMTPDYLSGFRDVLALTGADTTTRHTRFEIMQYNSREAELLAQHDSLPDTDLSNARFLAPYYDAHKLFEYVSGATLAIPVGDIARIAEVLRRDSIPVASEGPGAVIRLDGFTLHLIPPWAGAGVKQLQFALTRELLGNPTYRFGPTSQLRFGPGPTAVWDFRNHD